MRVNEPTFLQPMLNQWSGAFAGIPVVYVNVGMAAEAMEDGSFMRDGPN